MSNLSPSGPGDPSFALVRWLDPAVLALVFLSLAAGFGQFGVTTALGDVAKSFGHSSGGASLTDQAGLSGTQLGVGLAIIRLASLGALPLCGLADRFGRRSLLLFSVVVGLAITATSAASPNYWWFVALFALGRPFLSTTTALSQTSAAEQTASSDRAKAVAAVTAGYGVGAGLLAIIHSLAHAAIGFRGLVALALIPLAALPFVASSVRESGRFTAIRHDADRPLPVLGAVGRTYRRRLAVVVALSFLVSLVTGPANTFVFLYAQNIEHLGGVRTAAMVAGAGLTGLAGLLVGRYLADRIGRRATGAIGTIGIIVFGILTYSGPTTLLIAGYVLGVFSGAVLAPAGGALVNELFPTSVRASVSGWWLASGVLGAAAGLLAFGAVAQLGNRFSEAALVIFLPVVFATVLFWAVPETRGREPEDLWPDRRGNPAAPR